MPSQSITSSSTLPTELWIQVFSYLPVPSLAAVSSLSKAFHAFFNDPQNETTIWRNASLLHGLVGSTTLDVDDSGQTCLATEPPRREWGRWREWERHRNLNARHGEVRWSDVLDLYSAQSLTGFGGEVNWKAFLRRRLEIHRSWTGQLPSDIVRYAADDIRYASSANKSYLAALHHARKMGEMLPQDNWTESDVRKLSSNELSSPSGAVKEKLDTIKTVLGIASDKNLPPLVTQSLLYLETQWTVLWKSDVPQVVKQLVPSTKKVHRIKVDERNGFALTTQRDGGLVVTDIHTNEILWCLPKNYVHGYAHLEYEQGYFIVDRTDGSKEVWRSSSIDPPTSVSAPAISPDRKQRVASALANGDDDALLHSFLSSAYPLSEGILSAAWKRMSAPERGEVTPAMGIKDVARIALGFGLDAGLLPRTPFGWVNIDDLRRSLKQDDQPIEGEASVSSVKSCSSARLSPHFVPHMIIPVPRAGNQDDTTRAFRFVYPYLLAASQTRAYVWDIRTGQQVQIVESTQEFTVPDSYPFPVETVTIGKVGKVLFDPGEKPEADEVGHEVDGKFDVFLPFRSGFFDENATYSGNFESETWSEDTSNSRRIRSRYYDPLSLQMNPLNMLGHLFYVELSERWVFVCGGEGLRLFARGKEFFDHSNVLRRVKKNFGYDLQPGQLALRIVSDRIHYARWQAAIAQESFREHWGSELVRQQVVWDDEVQSWTEQEANEVPLGIRGGWPLGEPPRRRLKLHDEALAVHVSPDQKHFVAMFSSSRLLFVPYFERVIAGETSVWESGVDIQLGPVNEQSVYLSYGVGESGSGGAAGRITVVTEAGIFIVTPHLWTKAFSSGRKVDLVVHRLAPSFMDPKRLRDVSCLQMSDTGLWVNWHIPEDPLASYPFLSMTYDELLHRGGGDDESEWEDVEGDEDVVDVEMEDQEPDAGHESEEEAYRLHDFQEDRPVRPSVWGTQLRDADFRDIFSYGRDGKAQKSSNLDWMSAMEVADEERHEIEESGPSANAKGKEPQKRWSSIHPPGRCRVWSNQSFALDSTPPSRYQVEDGKCKWNYGELGRSKRRVTPEEKAAIDQEFAFEKDLRKRRMTKEGAPVVGTIRLPDGGLMVQTNADARVARRQEASFELHQIRFIPV